LELINLHHIIVLSEVLV